MLEPQERVLFSEALRPPEGYELSWAVGTTYTLDLVAAVAAPLAFALFDWEHGDGQRGPDPIPLLEALRRYADRLTVFVQAGQIAVPKPQQFLLSYLEDSIVEAAAPTQGGLFHPKVWLLRFAAEDEPVRYRFVCLTRNLTFDRAWDTAVVLEGSVVDRERAFATNRPLADFVAALPGLALHGVSPEVRRRIRKTRQEVLRVKWDLPSGFNDVKFWPMGVEGHRSWPFAGRVDRLLVVSPFLGPTALKRLARDERGYVLVSRLETLQELEEDVLDAFERIYVLDDGADLDAQVAEDEVVALALRGLHAKLYVADAGWNARLWTGSANATDAALGPNVEFLVELEGPKSKCGIDALLAKGAGEARFGDLLKPYVEHEYKPPDEIEEGLRTRIDEARLSLARAGLVARVEGEVEGLFTVAVVRGAKSIKLPKGVTVRCWPAMLGAGAAVTFAAQAGEVARFDLTGEELSSLFAFAVEAREGSRKREEHFTLNLSLQGAPEDRRERVLRSILRDRDRVLRFLLFLLADGDARQAAALLVSGDGSKGPGEGGVGPMLDLPLFESMLRALEHEPSKLDHVAGVIDELRNSPEGEALIPEGFNDVWVPIWTAREAMR